MNNSGTIVSQGSTGGAGEIFSNTAFQGLAELVNSGTISEPGVAVDALRARGGINVSNSCGIEGDVKLSDAVDMFDGRGGSALGTVFGGKESDVYLVDDESIEIVETASGGTFDVVRSQVSDRLVDNIETLVLLD